MPANARRPIPLKEAPPSSSQPPANAAPCSANSWRAMIVPRSRTRHWSATLRAAPGGASGGLNGARILPLSRKACAVAGRRRAGIGVCAKRRSIWQRPRSANVGSGMQHSTIPASVRLTCSMGAAAARPSAAIPGGGIGIAAPGGGRCA